MMSARNWGFAATLAVLGLALVLGVSPATAQPVSPPPPAEYKVQIRYRIRAATQVRVARFREMTSYLESLGFKKDPGPETEAEDADLTLMTGTIASRNARRLLNERHVQAILLVPAGFDLAAAGDQPVKIQLEIARALPLDRQRLLSEQVRDFLYDVGFRDAVGYDHRGFTRLVGAIPAGSAIMLLEDLRRHSSGWLAPRIPVADLPLPIRNTWPVDVIEVTPEPAGTIPAKVLPPSSAPALGEGYLLKISPELRALAKSQDRLRMEVILIAEPASHDYSWRRDLLLAVPASQLEGRLGPVVTVKAVPPLAADYARLTGVSVVRLPRLGSPQPAPVLSASGNEALRASGLDRLHAAGQRGRGVRIAVIDNDFRGYQQFLGKQLPVKTGLVDLTAECDQEIEPRVISTDTTVVGHGTACALAAALAAPEAELKLIRIDADAPFQLFEAARYIHGEAVFSVSLDDRQHELAEEAIRIQKKRDELLEERKALLDDFGTDETSKKKRDAFFAKEAALEKEEKELQQRDRRFLNLIRDLRGLKGIRIAACGLLWNEGYPVDDSSPLSRYLDAEAFKSTLWFQSIGNTQGQAWSGIFRDLDGNGVMEFAPPGAALKPGRWTSELNFLGWRPLTGSTAQDLPRTRLRISVQWREPHDPSFRQLREDPYLTPLANLRLLVLRQRDPSGTKLASDDLEVVARSEGLPLRINNERAAASYEQVVEFTPDTPGRYALRLEGRVPKSIRPASQPSVAGQETAWELQPRIFVNVLDESARPTGRAFFLDYATEIGNPGMPADAHGLISVGAADFTGQPRPYTASGPPMGQFLSARPDLFSFDALPLALPARPGSGTNLANAFAAGLAGSVLGSNKPGDDFFRALKAHPGTVLRSPPR